jgi:putative holliday junction resolvase
MQNPKMAQGRLLCIDHGIQRIGLAVCDPLRMVARELAIIYRTSRQADFDRINRLAVQEGVVGLIVGLPTDFEVSSGTHTQADTVRLWVERFQATTDLPVLFWDEQFSSKDATELARLQKRKPSDPIDDLAARLILQNYLDALRDGLARSIEDVQASGS